MGGLVYGDHRTRKLCGEDEDLPLPLEAGAFVLEDPCVLLALFWADTAAQSASRASARHWRVMLCWNLILVLSWVGDR